MTNQQRGIIAVVFAAALLGGALLAFLLVSRGSDEGVSQATTSPEAELSEAPSATAVASASLAPSEAPSAAAPSATAAPTASAIATPAPTPTGTPPPPAPATVVVTQLKLDAKSDPAGHSRRISFTTAGRGPVSVALRVTSPTGAAAICFAGGGPSLDCRTTRTTTFAARADSTHRDFAMSLRGSGDAAPIIDLTLTFPASTPAIMIERARFDGTNDPNLNGLQVIVHPRRGGDVTLDATWGQPYRYEVDLFEQGGDNRSQQFPNQPAASGVQQTFPITGTNPWKLVLQNIDAGNGVTQMTATIGWP